MRRVGTLTGLMQRFASPRVLRVASAAPRFAAASPLLCAAPRVAARSARGFAASGGAQPSLSSLLSRELEHELAEYETPELVKEGPPEPFELSEEPGSAVVVRRLAARDALYRPRAPDTFDRSCLHAPSAARR